MGAGVPAAAGAALAVLLLAAAVALPPTPGERLLRTLAPFRRVPGPDPAASPLRAAARAVADRAGAAVTPAAARVRLARLLERAGTPGDRPVEAVVRHRGALAVAAAGAAAGALVAAGPAGAALAAAAGAAAVRYAPELALRRRARARRDAVARALPDMLDVLVICVEAGLSLDAALAQVAAQLPGPLPAELRRVLQEMRIGVPRPDALRALADRVGVPELRRFVTAVVQAGELGVPIAGVLRQQARHQRLVRRQHAEEQAQKIPVKLLFPVLLCLFPVMFVVILGPALLRLLDVLGR